jgi:magnesium transporter
MEINRAFLKLLRKQIALKDPAALQKLFEHSHPADLAELAEYLMVDEFKMVFDHFEDSFRSDVLTHLSEDIRANFLSELSISELAKLIDLADSDDAVAVMRQLSLKTREEVLANMKQRSKARQIISLLPFDTSCAAGIMAKEFLRVSLDWTVERSMAEIRQQAEFVDKIHTIYVIGEDEKLLGRVSFKKMFFAQPDTLIKDLYNPKFQFVYTYTPVKEVIEKMSQYSLEVLPVVNAKGKLLGIITIDDTMDIVRDRADEMVQAMSGLSGDTEESDGLWHVTRARLPWLIIGILGGMLGAWFLGLFEEDLRILPAMAFFIPLITATGGNIGIQSATLVVQALASDTGQKDSVWNRLKRGFVVSLVNALLICILVFALSWILFQSVQMSVVVSVAIFSVAMISSLLGTATPLILNKLGVNPALASGPFITTSNDLLGLAIYFLIARALI